MKNETTNKKGRQNNMLTKTLRNGIEVTAKLYDGEAFAITYANNTQAERAVAALGDGWTVYQFGRPFYAGRKANSPNNKPLAIV
jgi:hypothetical protein